MDAGRGEKRERVERERERRKINNVIRKTKNKQDILCQISCWKTRLELKAEKSELIIKCKTGP